jgi:hypothetical protein
MTKIAAGGTGRDDQPVIIQPIRSRVLGAFEEAERDGAADREALMTFVIVGGGPTWWNRSR